MQKRRESGKRFSGGKVSRQKGEKYNVQRFHGHCVCVYMLFFFSVKRQCEEKEQRLAVLEENFTSTQKEVTELRSCLREVERSRLEARRELQELRRQVCRPSSEPM